MARKLAETQAGNVKLLGDHIAELGKALSEDWRGKLEAVAVIGGKVGAVGAGDPVTPCGRCRQVLNEVAALGGSDPTVWCVGEDAVTELRLSDLLPHAFGPASLD